MAKYGVLHKNIRRALLIRQRSIRSSFLYHSVPQANKIPASCCYAQAPDIQPCDGLFLQGSVPSPFMATQALKKHDHILWHKAGLKRQLDWSSRAPLRFYINTWLGHTHFCRGFPGASLSQSSEDFGARTLLLTLSGWTPAPLLPWPGWLADSLLPCSV